jgi:hypothetical protein
MNEIMLHFSAESRLADILAAYDSWGIEIRRPLGGGSQVLFSAQLADLSQLEIPVLFGVLNTTKPPASGLQVGTPAEQNLEFTLIQASVVSDPKTRTRRRHPFYVQYPLRITAYRIVRLPNSISVRQCVWWSFEPGRTYQAPPEEQNRPPYP